MSASFTAAELEDACNNDPAAYKSIVHHVKMLRAVVDRVAVKAAKANGEWHDDPEADDHAKHHAPAAEQYPRELRDETIRELVKYYLAELRIAANETDADRGEI
jgi:hypothetical protein